MIEKSFSWVQERGRNFTPAEAMQRHAKANPARWTWCNRYGTTVLKRRDGQEFTFDRYKIQPMNDLVELVTIYLKKAI